MTARCDPHSGVSAYTVCFFLFAAAPAAPLYVPRVKRLGPRACRVGWFVVSCRAVLYRTASEPTVRAEAPAAQRTSGQPR